MILKLSLASLSSFGFIFLMRIGTTDEGGLENRWFKGFGRMISSKKVAGGARNKAIYSSDKPRDASIDDLTQWSGV